VKKVRSGFVKEENGQSLVEFTLVLPLLLLLMMGIFEFGRIFYDYLIITNASREGARWAVVGKSDNEVINIVNDSCATIDLERLQIEITPAENERKRGEPLEISLRYEVDMIVPLWGVVLPDPFPIETHALMRME